MTDYIAKFINALINGGIVPKSTKDIKETKNFKRISSDLDKGTKKSISYWLRVEHDFAYGYARDFKTGIDVRFRSYNEDKTLTRSDIIRIKALMKARQAAEDLAIAERHSKIAERAKVIWGAALPYGTTPYLEAKKIDLNSARIIGDKVIVPIYENGNELVGWQMIRSDGTKRFPFGGKKQGCWHTIGQINPTEEFYLCEGFATGATIYQVTGKAVVVAFDAGNLLPVAKNLRKIYNNTHIIVAADNDASGVGQEKAEAVRKAISNCTVIMPSTVNSDFNDNPAGLSTDAGKNPPDSSMMPKASGLQTIGGDWMQMLTRDAKNRMIPYSLKNGIMFLQNHDDFKGVFVFDDFKQSVIMKKCPQFTEEHKFRVCEVNDRIVTMVMASLEDYGLMLSKDKVRDAIEAVARDNSINSAQEYFKNIKWDGVKRLDTMLKEYFNCTEDDNYLSWVGKKWMTAAVKRIFESGCKFDHILILESETQGFYKSSALKSLATFNGETYHTDSISVLACDNTYTPLKMLGIMIVELAELSGFSNKDDAIIKNWITQTTDRVKLPFDKFVSSFPRQFVFAATTNKTDYLKDPTGNRRYWPVTVGDYIDINKIEANSEQLWAEAYQCYKDGLYLGATIEENEIANKERQKRIFHDIWTDDVLRIIDHLGLDEFRTEDVIRKMNDLKMTDRNENNTKRITNILRMNGYINQPVWNRELNRTQRSWTKK